MSLQIATVGPEAAPAVLAVIRAAFGARPPLDPPAAALLETEESVREELAAYGGLLATVGGEPVGCLLYDDSGPGLALRRFGVMPAAQGHGVAHELVATAVASPQAQAWGGLRVVARAELPKTLAFWEHQGFVEVGRDRSDVHLVRLLPRHFTAATPEDLQAVAERVGAELERGDLVILTGDLGAGKTTFTQGLGRALKVRGAITSPTFVIARVHPAELGGVPLVHVDAYRLGGLAELDDLDLDTELESAVTVVEWGEGLAEELADDRLEIALHRGSGPDDETRKVTIQPVGLGWLGRHF